MPMPDKRIRELRDIINILLIDFEDLREFSVNELHDEQLDHLHELEKEIKSMGIVMELALETEDTYDGLDKSIDYFPSTNIQAE